MDDRHDDLDDGELGAALHHRADELTGPIDLDAAFGDTIGRARSRRRWRMVATTMAAAAAVVAVLVVGIATVGRDDGVVRSPAATPPGPGPTTAGPTAGPTIAPTTTVASTATTTSPSTSAPAPAASVPPAAAPGITAFSSTGGSIEVRLADGQISLAADPIPVSGWSVRIDDNGPDRVRVRFENGFQRAEIRVELAGETLEHRITEE